jgi:Tfp pilus assembly ATPase PilU
VVERELHARPSDLRAQVLVQLCRHLHADVQEYLADHGISGRVGVFERLFGAPASTKQ